MVRWITPPAVCAALATAACGLPAMTASPEREAEARALLEELAAGQDDRLTARMSARVEGAQMAAQLPFLKSLVPQGPVPEGETVGWHANAGTAGSTYEVVRTYDYPDRVLTVSTMFMKEGAQWKVVGFHLAPTMKAGATPVTIAPPDPG